MQTLQASPTEKGSTLKLVAMVGSQAIKVRLIDGEQSQIFTCGNESATTHVVNPNNSTTRAAKGMETPPEVRVGETFMKDLAAYATVFDDMRKDVSKRGEIHKVQQTDLLRLLGPVNKLLKTYWLLQCADDDTQPEGWDAIESDWNEFKQAFFDKNVTEPTHRRQLSERWGLISKSLPLEAKKELFENVWRVWKFENGFFKQQVQDGHKGSIEAWTPAFNRRRELVNTLRPTLAPAGEEYTQLLEGAETSPYEAVEGAQQQPRHFHHISYIR